MKFDGNKKSGPVKSYHEKEINKTIYRITGVYMGQFELGKAIEDLVVKKILRGGVIYYDKYDKTERL